MSINPLMNRNLLEIFDLITTQGIKGSEGYEFADIKASYDFDGYTCWIVFKDLTVTLLFHGKYAFDYTNQKTLKEFFNKVSELLANKKLMKKSTL